MKNLLLKLQTYYVLFGILLTGSIGYSQNKSQTFSGSGTFTVPAGVTQLTVEAWGGGGKGSTLTTNIGGGGGGGGAYMKGIINVTPSTTYTVTVGTGSSTTAAGGDSWFNNSTTIIAKGGSSAADNSSIGAIGGIATAACIPCTSFVSYNGGNGANGSGTTYGGGGGSSAGNTQAGNSATSATGATAPTNGGNGANGRSTTQGNGTAATGLGGGGGGALRTSSNTRNGGNGANGQVVISWDEAEINITGNAVSIADGDITPSTTDATDFGSVAVASGTITKTYTIQNTGTVTLTLGTITLSGANAADFSITTYPGTSIAPGGSTTFTLSFDPSAGGTRSAVVSIVNSDSDENPYDFAIQGTGLEQEIDIRGNGVSIVDGDTTPSTTDWTDFGSTNPTRTYIIYNTGTTDLTIGTLSLSGTNPGDFAITTAPNSIVAPGTSTMFTVTFTPSAAGVRSATISIINNDSNENPYDFKIQGTGVAPNMTVKGNNVAISDGDTTPTITDWTDFNSTNIYSPITRVYTIENSGNLALNLTGTPIVSISGSTDFTISMQPASTVQQNNAVSFTVSFSPTVVGIKTADISIANNDSGAGKNPYTFRVTGTAVQTFIDSDGDGVFNNVDNDDDNDGIPDYIEQSYASGSVLSAQVQITLLNETFGAGTGRSRINSFVPTASTTYCYEDGTTAQATDECDTVLDLNDGQYTVNSIAGTTAVASWAPSYWYQGPDHTPSDTNGRMALFNATNNITDEFYRTIIQGVIPNAPLTYSFYVLNLDRTDAPGIATRNRPNLTVEFRDLSNNLISTLNTGNIPPTSAANPTGDWYQFSSSFTPTTTGFSIVFKNNQPGGLGNDLALDDIKIIQTITDTDQDGIGDVYDLDSDNDGIGGIIEDGWAALSNGKDRMDLSPSVWIDADGDGWHDTVQAWYAAHGPANFDGDAVPNYIDLDSDNDSLFDVDEAGIYNGDGDVNGDGEGEGADPDADGIVGIFDTLSGYGNSGKALPVNSYGAANPDYLNVMSKPGVYDISTTLYASLDANNDGIIDGTTDADRDGILDAFDTSITVYGSPRDLNRKLLLDFDGRNDYAEKTAVLGGLANASIMAWIDLNPAFNAEGVVVGQDKFHLKINSNKKLAATVNGTTLTYNTALNTAQWYHVAAVYGGGSLKLYLNGNLVATQSLSGSIAADATKLTLGRNPNGTDKYFKGKMDEVRIFNVALSDAQLQRMVYQEIQNNSSQVRGAIIPKDIGALPFANLLGYFRMDTYKDDIVDDLTTPAIDIGTGMKMYNHKNIYVQQAPMPFVTERAGTFATAVNSPTKDIRGLDIMDQDWSIVQVKHDITETANNTDLGMFVDSGVTINMNNDTKIQNDWYLLLNGKIDLKGKSQLVQTAESDLEPTSSGYIERDQQGQTNKFNYNYWSSPVSSINNSSINNGYTVAGVMKDGTDVDNIQDLLWTSDLNSIATTPITLSSYWIFKYQNLNNNYYNWEAVGPNGSLLPGQGYTLKGSNALTPTQNYTFVGKPNNGTITSTVSANNLILCGNPYASAIDANAFITDNSTATTGTLYFWEHYSTNSSHVTVQYQGGYATRSLVGGTPPVAPAGISGLGSSSKTPGRFIPVGSGFFVSGSATGGTITFNNSQRLFVKEEDSQSNTLFRTANPTVSKKSKTFDNSEDVYVEDDFMKLRLGFTSSDNMHRQILIGFMNEKATSGIDVGYDAVSLENLSNDMYFINGTAKLNIQGEGYFNHANIYPLGVKNATAGNVTFAIDGKENFPQSQKVFIYDNVTKKYNNIKSEPFTIALPAGTIEDRFSLRFKNGNGNGNGNQNRMEHAITVSNISDTKTITITNGMPEIEVKSVLLYNMIGQQVAAWDVEQQDQTNIELSTSGLTTGAYIVKAITDDGEINKKILVN
ncbi:choice-of-anchor D domain-containing protein [Flavobacterium silvisoli]|uniref:Choice-of-anchor D domain-containing protein n=1 Tax=Flavobacterium silvisoli TaxID=2529433 RepID=A0A4Q9Z2M1_9FLAO|nr:choice-of-anchor D domain-containing protein [Flavobacterium silvisoli]TBX70432.1 choice-of-anchor D domain-containing protein [Flavobacterium silvisoli]